MTRLLVWLLARVATRIAFVGSFRRVGQLQAVYFFDVSCFGRPAHRVMVQLDVRGQSHVVRGISVVGADVILPVSPEWDDVLQRALTDMGIRA